MEMTFEHQAEDFVQSNGDVVSLLCHKFEYGGSSDESRTLLSITQTLELPVDSNKTIHLRDENEFPLVTEVSRSLGMIFGSRIASVRFSCAMTSEESVLVLIPHLSALESAEFSALQIGSLTARSLAAFCRYTLMSLRLRSCPRVTNETLGWLAGDGLGTPGLTNLRALDISHSTSVGDRGAIFIVRGLGQLEHLDMEECGQDLTFASKIILEELSNSSGKFGGNMKYLNLRGCRGVSDKGVIAIARATAKLKHLNLSHCGGITDESAFSLALHCRGLEALSIEGASKVSDRGLGAICRNTKLNLLNIGGCNISRTSLMVVIKTLGYVQEASAFFGFTLRDGDARDNVISNEALYYSDQRRNTAAHVIQRGWNIRQRDRANREERKLRKEAKAAEVIARFLEKTQSEERCNRLRTLRDRSRASTCIQSYARGWLSCRRVNRLITRSRAVADCAVLVQARYRGTRTRRHDDLIRPALESLWVDRLLVQRTRAALALQRFAKCILAKYMLVFLKEDFRRRTNSAVLIQSARRRWVKRRRERTALLFEEMRQLCLNTVAIRIQCAMRQYFARRRLNIALHLSAEKYYLKHASCRTIQSLARGWLRRREHGINHKAATRIQTLWRGFTVPGWRDIKKQTIVHFVRMRAGEETNQALRCRLLYTADKGEQKARAAVMDGEVRPADKDFGSMPREDLLKYVFGQAFVGLEVKIYWHSTYLYRKGIICDYSERLHLWRVHYMDDETEWIDVVREGRARILVKDPAIQDWAPFHLFVPSSLAEYLISRQEVDTVKPMERISEDDALAQLWYVHYVTRGLLKECYQNREEQMQIEKLRSAHCVRTLTVAIAMLKRALLSHNFRDPPNVKVFEDLLAEMEQYIESTTNL